MTRTGVFCSLLRWSGALAVRARLWRDRTSTDLTILAYHRVLPASARRTAPDAEVVSCTPEEFVREIGFVRRHFDVIRFADIERLTESVKRPVILTFDDGYKDNAETVLPLLSAAGVAATFFVTTGYIGTGALPWWDEICWLVTHPAGGSLDLKPLRDAPLSVRDATQRNEAVAVVLHLAKTCGNADRLTLLENLRAQSDHTSPPGAADLMMNWDDVRRLAAAGMEIGSHTVSHPVLGNVGDSAELQAELGESRRMIQQQVGVAADVISYPVGRKRDVTDAVVEAARASGYRYGCVYEHGVNSRQGFDPFRLKRIKAEVGTDFTRFRAKVLFPGKVRY